MKSYLYTAAAFIASASLLVGCSSTPTSEDVSKQLDAVDQQLLDTGNAFPISQLSYYDNVSLEETKKAASELSEKMKSAIPIEQGDFTIFGQGYDATDNIWMFQVNIGAINGIANAKALNKELAKPGEKDKMASAMASALCKVGEDQRNFRTILASGLKLRYILYYKNQHVTDIDVTKDTYCRKPQ